MSADAKTIQRALIAHGFPCGPCGADGIIGPDTRLALGMFQSRHGLLITNGINDNTLAALALPPPPIPPQHANDDTLPIGRATGGGGGKLRTAVLDLARSFLGTRERGNNDGPAVRRFLADVGLSAGNPWCMAFVQYCVHLAATALELPDPLRPDSGHCLTVWQQTPARRRRRPESAQPGDVFVMFFGGGKGHTGFIEARHGNSATTIEGNTDGSGGREGDGVYRRRRALSDFEGCISLD